MPIETFVDTGAWVAITHAADAHHIRARETLQRISRQRRMRVTTNMIIAESYTLIARRVGYRSAIGFLQSMREIQRLERVVVTTDHTDAAERLLDQYSDQDFSYVDAVSFVVMRDRGISEAFAFDQHFMTAGFVTLPSPPR